MKRLLYLLLVIILLPAAASAADFGFVTSQYAGAQDSENDGAGFVYRGDFLPRFSSPLGATGFLSVSAGFTIGYGKTEDFYYVPELLRTELSFRAGQLAFRAGRISYTDPLAFIADGLFDGLHLTYSTPAGRFGIGAWYTGLLYKKNADIEMTESDREKTGSVLDYNDFADTYFAPRRLLASLEWEHPSLGEILRLRAAVTGQFDLSGEEDKLHSQYFILKAGLPVRRIYIEAGGSLQLSQYVNAEDNIGIALAGDIGLVWTMPVSFISRLSFNGKIASGIGGSIDPFIPVTSVYTGQIFQNKMTAITALALNYSARIIDPLGASLGASYFIRNGSADYNNYGIAGEDSGEKMLGAEFSANIVFSPVSDLQLVLGAGIFAPSMGNVWKDADPKWRIDLTAILALY